MPVLQAITLDKLVHGLYRGFYFLLSPQLHVLAEWKRWCVPIDVNWHSGLLNMAGHCGVLRCRLRAYIYMFLLMHWRVRVGDGIAYFGHRMLCRNLTWRLQQTGRFRAKKSFLGCLGDRQLKFRVLLLAHRRLFLLCGESVYPIKQRLQVSQVRNFVRNFKIQERIKGNIVRNFLLWDGRVAPLK